MPPGIALPTLQLNSPTDLVSPPPGATAIDVNIVNGPAPTIQALPTGIALPTLQVPVESALLPPHAEMTVNGPAPSIQARPVTAPTAPPQPAAAPGASNQLPLVAPLGSDAVVTTINGPAPTAQPEAAGAPDVLSAQPLASPLPDPAGVLPVNDPVQPSEQHIVQTPLPVTQQRKSATTKRPGQTPGPKLSKAVFTDRNGRTYPILSTAIPQIASNQLLAQTIFRGYLTAEGQVFLASPYLYVEKRAMVRAFQGTYMNATATNLAPPAQVPSAAQIYINFGTNVTGSTLYGQVANRFPSKKKQTRCGTSLADTAAQKAYYNGLIPTDLAKLEWVPATSKTLNSAFVVKFGSVGSG